MINTLIKTIDKINFTYYLNAINNYAWGWPTIILLLGTGFYFSFTLKGLQFTKLGYALKLIFTKSENKKAKGDISHFQALMTALAATVGVGNIAGVATAISLGGPGALFWMWITGLVGMVTKYTESLLAVKYREVDENGNMSGGPMYYITKGLKLPWLGAFFAICTAIAAFGIGNMVQSNSVAHALSTTFSISPRITGIVLTLLVAGVIVGGIKSIARTVSVLVPIMIVFYMGGALIIICKYYAQIPNVFSLIFTTAFTGHAAIGGFTGAILKMTIQKGISRGIFSNESGMGSAPIAAAAAKTTEPVRQALVSMTQTFIDTIIVCSMTGFVILLTGAWVTGKTGAELTTIAFSRGLPGEWGVYIVTIGITLFAFSTLIGWNYYGEKAIEYLLGIKSIIPYRIVFSIIVFFGAVLHLKLVWTFADIANAFMIIPNLIGLIGLRHIVIEITNAYFNKQKKLSKFNISI
ncbi:alanine/glycine:cation symporter family protein [Candidatus Margulisiibacteriota bacterium]